MQTTADKYPLNEGMDLSVARQRFCVSTHTHTHTSAFTRSTHTDFKPCSVQQLLFKRDMLYLQAPSLLSPEAQFLVSAGCENGVSSFSASSMGPHRPSGFKALGSRAGSASPAAPHSAFMSPHAGEPNPAPESFRNKRSQGFQKTCILCLKSE